MWNQWSFLLSQPNSFFPHEWLQSHTLRSLKGILGILYIWRISVVLVPFVFLLRIKLNPWGTWESLRATVPKICPSAGVLVSRPGGRCLCSPHVVGVGWTGGTSWGNGQSGLTCPVSCCLLTCKSTILNLPIIESSKYAEITTLQNKTSTLPFLCWSL